MKKIAFWFVAMMAMVSTVSAQKITLDGSWAALKGAGTYALEVDYSALQIEDKETGEFKSVEEFLKTRDEKFCNAWNTEIVPGSAAYALLVPNYANKKFTYDQMAPEYKFVLKVDRLKLGFAGGAFIPFAGAKAGGGNISGEMKMYDAKSGELLGSVVFEDVQGVSHVTDAVRWGLSYYELGKRLMKAVKKAK